MNESETAKQARAGVAYGLAAYLWWGLVPIYFKAVKDVAALEVLAHRIIWSVVLLGVLMRMFSRWQAALDALRSRRTMLTLAATTLLIAVNWFLFIWAVANDKVLQASLGYFTNPLISVLLGVIFLRERLRRWQTVSVVLAGTGVAYLALAYGEVPLVALALAFSFGFYGLLRKIVGVDALVGLTIETMLLLPLAMSYAVYLAATGQASFMSGSTTTTALLMMCGIITAVPLLWFTNAARRLRLATLGFLQYIAPTLQLLLAIALYGETFTVHHLVTFTLIWIALGIYSADALRFARSV